MLKIRKSEERGHVQFTWLDTSTQLFVWQLLRPEFPWVSEIYERSMKTRYLPVVDSPAQGHQDM